jgi:large conductance mechanosensitive channel
MSVLKEFREFAVKGHVIDLAVGVIIGAAFGKIVDSVVRDLIMPVVGLAFGKVDFSQYFFALGQVPAGTLQTLDALRQAGVPVIAYGSFVTVALNFIILAFIIFFMVKQINRLKSLAEREKQEEASQPNAPSIAPEVALLTEIRDALRSR